MDRFSGVVEFGDGIWRSTCSSSQAGKASRKSRLSNVYYGGRSTQLCQNDDGKGMIVSSFLGCPVTCRDGSTLVLSSWVGWRGLVDLLTCWLVDDLHYAICGLFRGEAVVCILTVLHILPLVVLLIIHPVCLFLLTWIAFSITCPLFLNSLNTLHVAMRMVE